MKTYFKKLENYFSVESTKIENTSLSCKAAISEANAKTNRMVSPKLTYQKGRSFASVSAGVLFDDALSLFVSSNHFVMEIFPAKFRNTHGNHYSLSLFSLKSDLFFVHRIVTRHYQTPKIQLQHLPRRKRINS